uniref:MATE efflux family protein n=1 Tax=Steinernema glaseri TaxID=37863 RepID=A0A1I7YGV8_9BILA
MGVLTSGNGQSSLQKNNFLRCAFYVRLATLTIPVIIDITLAKTAGIDLARIVGPYGTVLGSIDFTAQTAAFYWLMRDGKRVSTTPVERTK